MTKYKETPVVGESWKRASKIVCDNHFGQIKSVRIEEQEVYNFSDGKIVVKDLAPFGQISQQLTTENANTIFNQRNPVTEEVTNQVYTYNDVYVILHSLYYHLAEKRDLEEQFRDPLP